MGFGVDDRDPLLVLPCQRPVQPSLCQPGKDPAGMFMHEGRQCLVIATLLDVRPARQSAVAPYAPVGVGATASIFAGGTA